MFCARRGALERGRVRWRLNAQVSAQVHMRSPAVGCIQPSPGVSGSCALKERTQRRQLPLSLADVNELAESLWRVDSVRTKQLADAAQDAGCWRLSRWSRQPRGSGRLSTALPVRASTQVPPLG